MQLVVAVARAVLVDRVGGDLLERGHRGLVLLAAGGGREVAVQVRVGQLALGLIGQRAGLGVAGVELQHLVGEVRGLAPLRGVDRGAGVAEQLGGVAGHRRGGAGAGAGRRRRDGAARARASGRLDRGAGAGAGIARAHAGVRRAGPGRVGRGAGRDAGALARRAVVGALDRDLLGLLAAAAAAGDHGDHAADHHQAEQREQPGLALAGGHVDDLRVAPEQEVLARLDEAEPDVAEVDGVAAAQLDLAVVLAVDPHAVARLQIHDRVAAGVGLAHDLGVVAADRPVVDHHVVVVGAADDHLLLGQLELAAGEVRRQHDDAGVAAGRGHRRRGDRPGGGVGVGQAQRHRRRRHRRAWHRRGQLRRVEALDRLGARVLVRDRLLDALGLQLDQVVADLDAVADRQDGALGDAGAVDPHAVVATQIFDRDRPVGPADPRVLARDVALGQADGVALLAADRDLVAHQRDDRRLSLVILDH